MIFSVCQAQAQVQVLAHQLAYIGIWTGADSKIPSVLNQISSNVSLQG